MKNKKLIIISVSLAILLLIPLSVKICININNDKTGSALNTAKTYGFQSSSAASSVDENSYAASGKDSNKNPYFNATVLQVGKNSILVKPDENSNENKSSDEISVSTKFIYKFSVPKMKAGDKVRIVYNGEIGESCPAQITNVFVIYLLDENGIALSPSTLQQVSSNADFTPASQPSGTYSSSFNNSSIVYGTFQTTPPSSSDTEIQNSTAYIIKYKGKNDKTNKLLQNKEFTVSDNDSATLNAILKSLDYNKPYCKCLGDFYVNTKFGTEYNVNIFSNHKYVKYNGKQAVLSDYQANIIKAIIEKACGIKIDEDNDKIYVLKK